MSNISVVIPNWNGENKLKKNLPKVLKLLDQESVAEVLVVDDASTDESVSLVERSFPEVTLIKKIKNEGFASTVNLGVVRSKGDFIFLLNNDATPFSNCVKFALVHFNNPKVFSVGCNTGGSWAWAKFDKGFFWHYSAKEKPNEVHQTLWASGGSGVFRRSIWDELGGLDEMYDPFYEEDVDLGYRATKRGYINFWEPKSKVEHYSEEGVISVNFSKRKIQTIAQRNQLLFIWKNITSWELLAKHFLALLKLLFTKPSYFRVFILSLLKLPDVIKKRGIERKRSVLRDEQILSQFSTSV